MGDRFCAAWSNGVGVEFQEELWDGKHTSCSEWASTVGQLDVQSRT
jgi:hypothetical protein